jgi:hypothetical protein
MINTKAEYALYLLAVSHPDDFADAERFTGNMLANNQDALTKVKSMLATHVAEHAPPSLSKMAETVDPSGCIACGTSRDPSDFCYAHNWMGRT